MFVIEDEFFDFVDEEILIEINKILINKVKIWVIYIFKDYL